MTQLPALPGTNPDTTADEALNELAATYGVQAVQAMVRWMTRNQNGAAINDWLVRAAGTAVHNFMEHNKVSYATARKAVAEQWGYQGRSQTNFYKLADRGYYEVTGEQPDRPRSTRAPRT